MSTTRRTFFCSLGLGTVAAMLAPIRTPARMYQEWEWEEVVATVYCATCGTKVGVTPYQEWDQVMAVPVSCAICGTKVGVTWRIVR